MFYIHFETHIFLLVKFTVTSTYFYKIKPKIGFYAIKNKSNPVNII